MLMATGIALSGQQSNTLYLMHPVPQSNLLNPAVQATCRLYVGIPVLTSAYISYSNTAFTYNDLAGSDTWNLEGTASQMHRRDLYIAEAGLQLISLGYRHRLTYFTFDVAEKGRFYSVVPGDLVSMAVFGNGPSVGETERFRSFRPGATYKREYAFGISRVLNRNLTVGARAKLIFGKASLSSGPSDLRIRTEENSFNLLLDGNYTIKASFPLTVSQDAEGNITDVTVGDLNYGEMLLNRRNPGLGIDLGMIYRLDERITLSASLLDVGFIRWRTDLNSVSTEGTFDYRGVDAGTDVVSLDYLEQMIDSLRNSFSEEVYHQPYTTYPPVQLFLGGSYRLREHMTMGLVNRNVIFRSKIHSSFTFSLQEELGNRFLATASWSYLNNSLANLGAGIAYIGRGVQFHVVSDNLLGFFFPFDTRTINLRIGVNLMLGCPRSKKEEIENSGYGNLPDPESCGTGDDPKKEARKMKRAARRINRK